MASTFSRFLPALILLGLLFWFWHPALIDGRTIIHGDSLLNGLPLMDLLARALQGEADLLWSQGIYGGHPIFAEGPGGFASPLNLFVASVIVPFASSAYGANLVHFLAMAVAGIGMIGLCRTLGTSAAAAGFAAIATVLSPSWIAEQDNLAISSSLAFVPWSLWALEAWLKRPSLRSAAWLGIASAQVLLGGYPQTTHGMILYMAVRLLVLPFEPGRRPTTAAAWRHLAGTGLVGLCIGVGLAAIQWLPLLELAGLSYRSGGVAVGPDPGLPIRTYLDGLLFTLPEGVPRPALSLGSLLVCGLGSLALLLGAPSRAKGHALAALFLLALGLGYASPVFRLLHDHQLIPGLGYFRIVHLYLRHAVIGLAVLAAFGIDALARAPIRGIWRLALLGTLWGGLVTALWTDALRPLQLGLVLIGLGGAALLRWTGCGALVPGLLLICLTVETAALRLHELRFFDPAILTEPGSVAAVKGATEASRFSIRDDPAFLPYTFLSPRAPGLAASARRAVVDMGANLNLLWDLPSIDGSFALPLRRRMMLKPALTAEIAGLTETPPGQRLIDILSIRFLSAHDDMPTAPGFRLLWHGADDEPRLFENEAAKPRFQLYGQAVGVASPEAALAALAAARMPILAVEGVESEAGDAPPAGEVSIVRASATTHRLHVTTQAPAWLFMADANYPGWRALVDGEETPVYSAQILGKAIRVPAGDHVVLFAFLPLSVEMGAALSGLSLVAVMVLGWSPWASRPR